MLVRDLLWKLDLGSSVAEHDELLERYFVETESFRMLIQDRKDVVAGDKGAGKSALYRILDTRYAHIDELKAVQVVSAFNPVGTPVFQRLSETDILSEAQYIKIWKAYFLALAGNWILEFADGDFTESMMVLHQILDGAGLRTKDDSPNGVFARIFNRVTHVLKLRSAEARLKAGPAEIAAKVELLDSVAEPTGSTTDYDSALRRLDIVMSEMDTTFWLAIDRLDEAFQGRPELEKNALRALFRTFLDMQEFTRIKLKLFVRRDLFSRIIAGGFVNLTHVNARKVEIFWDEADLYSLLHKRIMQNSDLVAELGLAGKNPEQVFSVLFPTQVDPGSRKPTTWTWMLGRIGDGNGVRPPRNLIDLVLKSKDAQLRIEDRAPREYVPGLPVITSEALKKGLAALSAERVQDTLLAEAGEFAVLIDRFRDGKAEHDKSSLSSILGENSESDTKYLESIGFLEKVGSNYKIPMLYRSGLKITQGRASGGETDSDDESEDS